MPKSPLLVGLHRNYIADIERAERTPSIVTADKLAKALGTTLAGIFSKWSRIRTGLAANDCGGRVWFQPVTPVMPE